MEKNGIYEYIYINMFDILISIIYYSLHLIPGLFFSQFSSKFSHLKDIHEKITGHGNH